MSRAALLLFALLAALPAVAVAEFETPAAGEVIRGCVGPSGWLRVPDPSDSCRSNERPLAWNVRGGPRLLDATGRVLGRVVPNNLQSARMFFDESQRLLIEIDSRSGELRSPSPTPRLLFSGPGCTGRIFTDHVWDAGRLFSDPGDRSRLFLVTTKFLGEQSYASSRLATCVERSPPPTVPRTVEVVPFEAELGFEVPVPIPFSLGNGALGPVEGEEVVDACWARSGRVRVVESGDACRPSEQPIAWQRLGGLRVFDAAGRDLGAYVRTVSGLLEIFHPGEQVWLRVEPLQGTFVQRVPVYYAERDCGGQAWIEETPFENDAGRLFQNPAAAGAFLQVISRREEDTAVRSRRRPGEDCESISSRLITGLAADPFEGELGFGFPLPAPLVPGFPGSPPADPGGDGPAPGILHACVNPGGQLRVVPAGSACRGSERPLTWPRRGGLRVLAGEELDLGVVAEWELASSRERRVFVDDESGIRFAVEAGNGAFADEESSPLFQRVRFSESECRGVPFRLSAGAGHVFPNPGSPTGSFFGTRDLSVLQSGSFLGPDGVCNPETVTWTLLPRTVVEPFEGEVPFEPPVALPIHVGSEFESPEPVGPLGAAASCDADYDDDGIVGAADLNRLRKALGSRSGQPGFDAAVDCDGDGAIGSAEFQRMRQQFGGPPGVSGSH